MIRTIEIVLWVIVLCLCFEIDEFVHISHRGLKYQNFITLIIFQGSIYTNMWKFEKKKTKMNLLEQSAPLMEGKTYPEGINKKCDIF